MPRITPDIVSALKAQADVADIIGRFLPLKRSGNGRFLAVCPFHDDHSPSMSINSAMGIYKCFACGAAGDVIKFVQEHEGIDFLNAVQWIAKEIGFPLPEGTSDQPENDNRAIALQLHELATAFYEKQLRQCPEALRYLEERSIQDKTINLFRLGWAPREGLLSHALREGFTRSHLLEFGLVSERETGGANDRFRERLQFPIQNLTGKVLAFGGRTLQKSHGNIPKYLNSPETLLYHKSHVLYGLHQARHAINSTREAIVVEGYFDVAQLHQAGISNTIAVSGTAFSEQQAKILARYAQKIYLVFDGDEAGRKAVRRSLDVLLPLPVEVRVLMLMPGEDPDSIVRTGGADAFLSRLPKSTDFLDFLTGRSSMQSPEERSRVYQEAGELIGRIGDPLLSKEYTELAARRFALRPSMITQAGAPKTQNNRRKVSANQDLLETFTEPPRLEYRLAALLFQHPMLFGPAVKLLDPAWLESQPLAEILDHALALQEEKQGVQVKVLLERLPEALHAYLTHLPPEEWSARSAELEFTESLLLLAERWLERKRQQLRTMDCQTDAQEDFRLRKRLDIQGFMRDLHKLKTALRAGELTADGVLRRYQNLRDTLTQSIDMGEP